MISKTNKKKWNRLVQKETKQKHRFILLASNVKLPDCD